MANNYFQFKQFTIHQEKSAMKVGTDGVLLGAWADCQKAAQILDIGTGTGLIAIMLAQRSDAIIDAVELENNAACEAELNASACKWKNRIIVCNKSIQQFAAITNKKYDLIVSNPPYFTQSQKTNNEARNFARHNDSLSVSDLFNAVDKLLAENGSFSLIIPTEALPLFLENAKSIGLTCYKKLWIWPTPEIKPKRILLSFSKQNINLKEHNLIIETTGRHRYSSEYKNLTKDFYLAF